MKNHLLPLLALSALLLASCVSCYNERFGQDMIGRSSAELVSIIGPPTSKSSSDGTTFYTWFTDQSYVNEYTTGGYETTWKDRDGTRHTRWMPAERHAYTVDKRAELTFMVRNGRVVNYRTNSDYSMCNAFIPPQYLSAYQAEEKASK